MNFTIVALSNNLLTVASKLVVDSSLLSFSHFMRYN